MFISHFFGMDASTASATNYLKKFTKHGGLVEGSGFEKDFWDNLLIVHFIKVLVTGQMILGDSQMCEASRSGSWQSFSNGPSLKW